MNRIKLICILILCIIFSGCREYGEKRIVKLITVSNETVAVYYYDYSQEKTAYLKEEKENKGIGNTVTELLSEYDYDLKLCKYAVCDKSVVQAETDVLYNALIDAKFSPDIVILEGDTKKNCEEYIELKQKNYPVYSYKVDETVTGVVERTDDNMKNLIIGSKLYKELSEEQSFVFDILNNTVKNGIYIFEHDGKKFSAELSGISAFFCINNTELDINISATLKSYKGMASNEKEKQVFNIYLKKSIADNARILLNDRLIAENFNLLWYSKIADIDSVKVNVNII